MNINSKPSRGGGKKPRVTYSADTPPEQPEKVKTLEMPENTPAVPVVANSKPNKSHKEKINTDKDNVSKAEKIRAKALKSKVKYKKKQTKREEPVSTKISLEHNDLLDEMLFFSKKYLRERHTKAAILEMSIVNYHKEMMKKISPLIK
ncbi:MAG: hypothetical protein QM504_03235 [Pseudomonadota bacterium]